MNNKPVVDFPVLPTEEPPARADYRPLHERQRIEREKAEQEAKLNQVARQVTSELLDETASESPGNGPISATTPPDDQTPIEAPKRAKKAKKRGEERMATLGLLTSMRRTRFQTYCSGEGCREEFFGPLFSIFEKWSEMGDKGKLSWSIVIGGVTRQPEAYCPRHKPPKGSIALSIVEEELDF